MRWALRVAMFGATAALVGGLAAAPARADTAIGGCGQTLCAFFGQSSGGQSGQHGPENSLQVGTAQAPSTGLAAQQFSTGSGQGTTAVLQAGGMPVAVFSQAQYANGSQYTAIEAAGTGVAQAYNPYGDPLDPACATDVIVNSATVADLGCPLAPSSVFPLLPFVPGLVDFGSIRLPLP